MNTWVDATAVDLSDPAFWLRPRTERFAAFDLLRQQLPVSWQPPPTAWAPLSERPPRGYWAVTSYEGVRQVSRQTETFRSGRGVMIFDNLSAEDQYLNDGWVGLDAPSHTKLRRLVSGTFTPKMMRQIEGWITDETVRHIENVAHRGSCDFFADLAAPLPVGVICTMLGVPRSEQDELMRLVHAGVHFSVDVPFEETLASIQSVVEYAKALARRRQCTPADDLTTALVHSDIDGERLSDADVAATFWVIITGGSDTTSTTAAHAMIALSAWPDERRKLQGDYNTLGASAVEEMLRWATPVLDFRRTATRDATVEGYQVAEGDNVVMFYQSANRDEAVFEEPYRFDIRREPNPHVSFGAGGPHFCLGAHLARLELRTLFGQLYARLPDIEVSGDPVYVPGPFLDSVAEVPCQFTARRSKELRSS